METDLQKLVQKQKITQEKSYEIQKKISFTSNIESCIADVIIEAIVEKIEVKTSLFKQLSEIKNTDTIFASNTSSLSITKLAQNINNPARVIGMHFFNPAPLMKLVEVVITKYTNEKITRTIVDLTRQMGKEPVVCKDSPGFIVNRVARPFYIESFRIAEESSIGIETIDRLLESKGFKLGPFKLMDLIGNDVNYAVSCSVYEQLNNPERLKPSYMQKEKVDKNELGKKSGKGYYDYTPSP
jgi:3-hydroxybutyryl-CoA dehydrogenase